jgi:hypothetical protein
MASLTNVSGEPLELALQQGEIAKRLIDPGETVDISDYILAGYAWPAATWRVDGTDVVTLQGDVYLPPPEPAPAVVDAPLPDTSEE